MSAGSGKVDILRMTPHTPHTRSSKARAALALALASALVTGIGPAASASTPTFRMSQLTAASTTGYNKDGVAMSAPKVVVNGNTVTISAQIQTRRTVRFNHLMIHTPGHDTGFNDNKSVRGKFAWQGTAQLPPGTYQTAIAYQVGTNSWVHGPATRFTVKAPSPAPAPAPTPTPTPAPTPVSSIDTLTASGSSITASSSTLNSATLSKLDAAVRPTEVGTLWMSYGRSPSLTEVAQVANKYDVFVLNAWDTAQLREIKRVNPKAIVLVYKCLSSTRNYSGAVDNGVDAAKLPSGVGYAQASAQPSWFALNTAGRRIEWDTYAKHWQMAVWNADYQRAWVKSVTDEVVAEGWDGVMADNDYYTLKHYSSDLVAGTSTANETDAKIRGGLDQLVEMSGKELNKHGKIFIPNLSDGRLDLARWQKRAATGGIMEEQFTHWGDNPADGHVYDWGRTGWIDQTAELASPLTLAVTRTRAGDVRTQRFGYASALVRAQGRVVWMPHTDGAYRQHEWFSWQDIKVGKALAAGTRTGNGAWVRPFENAYVVVNPTNSAVTVRIPAGFSTTSVTVQPADAALITR